MSLPLVIVTTTVAISGVLYVSLNLLPKLQEEKKKTQNVVAYRAFISGVADFVAYGIRERWCISSLEGKKKGLIKSDLLLTNDCSSQVEMEKVVTFAGNLERILWDENTIGQNITNCTAANRPTPETSNTILAINCLRKLDGKTTTTLTYQDVAPADGKLTYHLTEDILKDMTDQHPLFIITKDVRQCIKSVDITIQKVTDIDNAAKGEERKIGISITSNFYKTKLSCLFLKEVSSKSYYTFYPRRLHNFSLIKYGDLDANLMNEFHGPVYVAGDLKLPAVGVDKMKTTIFYDTLTLGTFNSGSTGSTTTSSFRFGKIKNDDGTDFTFEERGDPYLGKQDNYPTFQGILGGLRLDAVEDKGLHNLFNYNSTSAGNLATLEQCIDENQVTTKPSFNKDSVLAYTNATTSVNTFSLKIAFTEKNRFKLSKNAPVVIADPSNGSATTPGIRFGIEVPPPPNGTKSLGNLKIKDGSNNYSATIGSGSQVNLNLFLEAFDITDSRLTQFKTNTDPVTKLTFNKVFPPGHVLENLTENVNFKAAAQTLATLCDLALSDDCAILGYATGPAIYAAQLKDFKKARGHLQTKLDEIKTQLNANGPAQMVFKTENLYRTDNKLIINQKKFTATYTDKWKYFIPLLSLTQLDLQFNAFHYGNQSLGFDTALYLNAGDENTYKLKKRTDSTYATFYSSNWYDLDDNTAIIFAKTPLELIELDCPEGMGLADWDLDMSLSTNFAWNYANSPPGVVVDSADHSPLGDITFDVPTASNWQQVEGYKNSSTKSVATICTIPAGRTHVYGLYVCEELKIKPRTLDLNMIGTFIVKKLTYETPQTYKVIWHSLWGPTATDLIMKDFNNPPGTTNNACDDIETKTLKDLIGNTALNTTLKICSPQEIVTNGPNNFTWTTVDPDIGLATPTDIMTSQKVKRPTRWVIDENSRVDIVR